MQVQRWMSAGPPRRDGLPTLTCAFSLCERRIARLAREVLLPRWDPELGGRMPGDRTRPAVLIVDDDADIRDLVGDCLETEG